MKAHLLKSEFLDAVLISLTLLMSMNLYADNSPLCFTARNGSIRMAFHIKNATHTIQKSKDGMNWNNYTSGTYDTICSGQSIYFRAETNQTYASAFGSSSDYSYFSIQSTDGGHVEGSGNIMSLYGSDCPDLQLQPYAFSHMFEYCYKLTSAPSLPSTKLADYCYWGMFARTNVVTAPILPATTLANSCYKEMFLQCIGITTIPSLPALNLASRCCESMFNGCTSLESAPEMPATNVADYCYFQMFSGCKNLRTVASLLPATTLANRCYSYMFYHCTSLKPAPVLPATTLAEACYDAMFSGCTRLTDAQSLPATTLSSSCYSYMFEGCTNLEIAPELPAKNLANNCYNNMFMNCTKLKSIPELPATTLEDYCYAGMFKGCSSLIVNETSPGKEWSITTACSDNMAAHHMFVGTSGSMNGTPYFNAIYYVASDPQSAVENNNMTNIVSYIENNKIVIKGAERHSFVIYDTTGKLIYSKDNANELEFIQLSTTGVYFVKFDNGKTISTISK